MGRDGIVRRNGMIVNLTGDDKVVVPSLKEVESFLADLPKHDGTATNKLAATWSDDKYLGKMVNEGFVVPSQVNYVVKGVPFTVPVMRFLVLRQSYRDSCLSITCGTTCASWAAHMGDLLVFLRPREGSYSCRTETLISRAPWTYTIRPQEPSPTLKSQRKTYCRASSVLLGS